MAGIEGGCRCGEVRYTLDLDAMPPVYACHCHQCQRWSGSAFSVQALVPEERISISGPFIIYEMKTEDRVSTQRICGTCHSRIYNTNTRRPGIAVIRAGTLDNSEPIECRVHIYAAFKQQWVVLPDDHLQWPEMAPPAEFFAALME